MRHRAVPPRRDPPTVGCRSDQCSRVESLPVSPHHRCACSRAAPLPAARSVSPCGIISFTTIADLRRPPRLAAASRRRSRRLGASRLWRVAGSRYVAVPTRAHHRLDLLSPLRDHRHPALSLVAARTRATSGRGTLLPIAAPRPPRAPALSLLAGSPLSL
ncbi:hypothetical protein Scep_019885 [Stephania cephalantha]|uniref:Uncharacterized protein n=1 Tax=Stephania cephalantha TaxID=152367 RepID=A0AAP0ICL0_9MAGN